MKKYISCIYVVLCTYLLLSYAAIAGTPPIAIGTHPAINNVTNVDSIGVDAPIDYIKVKDATSTAKKSGDSIITTPIDNNKMGVASHDQFYINLFIGPNKVKITTLDFQAIKKNTYVQLAPLKTDPASSTYEYFIVTCVEKSKSLSSPMSHIAFSKPVIQKHFYITPLTRKVDHNTPLSIPTSFLSSFFSLPPTNEITYTYHDTYPVPAADDDDEDPPFPLPIPGVGDTAGNGEKTTLDNGNYTNEQSYLSPRLIHLFKLINEIETTFKSIRTDEDPPFPLPIPGVGKEKKYILIATHADDEDPPFPPPIPGVGDIVEVEGVKEETINIHQYIFIPIDSMEIGGHQIEGNLTEEHDGDPTIMGTEGHQIEGNLTEEHGDDDTAATTFHFFTSHNKG